MVYAMKNERTGLKIMKKKKKSGLKEAAILVDFRFKDGRRRWRG